MFIIMVATINTVITNITTAIFLTSIYKHTLPLHPDFCEIVNGELVVEDCVTPHASPEQFLKGVCLFPSTGTNKCQNRILS